MSAQPAPASLANSLLLSARVVSQILAGRSLADGLLEGLDAATKPAVQDIVYGTLRAYGRGDATLAPLLQQPLAVAEIRALLLVALYRLETWPDAPHTVVDQAVVAAGVLAGGRFKGLVNGVLRNCGRRRDELLAAVAADPVALHGHPAWWLAELQDAYPVDWQTIVAADNTPGPMALRVNARLIARDAWLEQAAAVGIGGKAHGDCGVLLERPVSVDVLPGFANGWVSVQDLGAQRAAELLAPKPGQRVLDACAAPGGKTAHLLECCADIELTALDLDSRRCRRIDENLARLGLTARVQAADCRRFKQWWDGRPFERILADVPCSASGVVRRHPDAKWLRRSEDVGRFVRTQADILERLWQIVAPGGRLLYATCSVFPAENQQQIAGFAARHPESRCLDELQLLPNAEHDGFFYALLERQD
jgi:16S rRNA (cytosine967-C5)-methyltransferase